MDVFRLKTRKLWHIPSTTSKYAFCGNASMTDFKGNLVDGVTIKPYEGETLCPACVGQAYKAEFIDVVAVSE